MWAINTAHYMPSIIISPGMHPPAHPRWSATLANLPCPGRVMAATGRDRSLGQSKLSLSAWATAHDGPAGSSDGPWIGVCFPALLARSCQQASEGNRLPLHGRGRGCPIIDPGKAVPPGNPTPERVICPSTIRHEAFTVQFKDIYIV